MHSKVSILNYFYILGFLLILFESSFANQTIAFARSTGLPFFLWPSEIWFLLIGFSLLFINLCSTPRLLIHIYSAMPLYVILFILFLSFSLGFANNNPFAIKEFREFIFGGLGLIPIVHFAKRFKLTLFIKTVLYLAIPVSIYSILLSCADLGADRLFDNGKLVSNALSCFQLFVLSFLVGTFKKNWFNLLSITLVSLSLLFNFSKTTLVLLVALFFIHFLANYILNSSSKIKSLLTTFLPRLLTLFTLALLTVLGFLYFLNLRTNGVIESIFYETFLKQRFTSSGLIYFGDITGGRYSMWEAAISSWTQSIVFGHGFGSEVLVYSSGYSDKSQLHNYPLQLLLCSGLFGLVTIISSCFVWLSCFYKRYQSTISIYHKKYMISLISFVFVILFFSLFGQPLSYPPVSSLFWFSLGLLSTTEAYLVEQ